MLALCHTRMKSVNKLSPSQEPMNQRTVAEQFQFGVVEGTETHGDLLTGLDDKGDWTDGEVISKVT